MSLLGFHSLLAERSLFRDMGSGFREKREHFDATDLFCWFLIVIGIFVALGLIARIAARHDKHQLFNSPRGLFRALCRAHELDRAARRLLVQMARVQQLSQPARLFLEPECFDSARLGAGLEPHKQAIEALAKKLFAADSAGSAPPAPAQR